ncbi:MAG: DUF433 domain-containing protein [Thermoanaerobaculia bacterium]|nr:DUF433 domain-containing protein [Thermoanaerobaculia bacterium]
MSIVLPIETVVKDPNVRGGRPVIAGTELRISDVAAWHVFQGLDAEQIVEHFDLDLAQAYAALSYYYAHKAEIDAEIEANDAAADRWLEVLGEQGAVA